MHLKLHIIPIISLVLILIGYSTTGCSAEGDNVFDYRNHDASFSAVFSGEFSPDNVVCAGEKTDESITLTVLTPERSSGIVVTYDFTSVCVSVGDTTIPLSDAAAKNIKAFFDLLYPPAEALSEWTAKKSDDGLETYLVSPSGKVTLGENLLPVSVTVGDENNSEKTKTTAITDFVITKSGDSRNQ